MNFIGFGNRNISSFGIDKGNHQLSVQKTWSFFSDKIKILFESNDNVFLLNSEKHFCVTNSKNQSVVRVLSDILFDQAVMISDFKSSSIYLIGRSESDLIILKISNNEVIDKRYIDCDPIESSINIRGKFCIVNTRDHILIVGICKSEELTYEIFKIKKNFNTVEVLERDEDNSSLKIMGYSYDDSEGRICTFSTADETVQRCIHFKDSSLTQSKIEFGQYLCFSGKHKIIISIFLIFLVSSKIIKSSKLDISNNIYTFENICRNMYGDVLQLKYFVDSYGVSYFLSLHRRYFLIFLIETTRSGCLEASLLKSISIPDNEFTGNCLEIVVNGSNKVYLRDDSNAYQICLDSEIDKNLLLSHSLPLKISTAEFVLTILSRQDVSRINLNSLFDCLASPEHIPILESAFSTVKEYRDSVDISAAKALFSAVLRHKVYGENSLFSFLKDVTEFEILSSLRSDSQV